MVRVLALAAVMACLSACRGERAAPAAASPSVEGPSASSGVSERSRPPTAAPATAAPRTGPAFEGTAGIVTVKRDEMRPATLKEVRAAAHEGFDRVVFEFAEGVPGHHLEYVDKPVRRCGSGDPTEVAGDAWLEVRLVPSHAHDEQGRVTVADRERRPDLPILRELELTCDFEAHVTWVLGVSSPNEYRVLELADPPRLVVDVLHGRKAP